MSERSLWTEEETKRLRLLYVSGTSFDEIEDEFPTRSSNAIRQKASRLGLRRPTLRASMNSSQNVLRISGGNGELEDFLFRCGGCGSWIHANLNGEADDRTIVCRQCQTVLRYVA
jgi:hypothetical protein